MQQCQLQRRELILSNLNAGGENNRQKFPLSVGPQKLFLYFPVSDKSAAWRSIQTHKP